MLKMGVKRYAKCCDECVAGSGRSILSDAGTWANSAAARILASGPTRTGSSRPSSRASIAGRMASGEHGYTIVCADRGKPASSYATGTVVALGRISGWIRPNPKLVVPFLYPRRSQMDYFFSHERPLGARSCHSPIRWNLSALAGAARFAGSLSSQAYRAKFIPAARNSCRVRPISVPAGALASSASAAPST
jgi:hypothetical protein